MMNNSFIIRQARKGDLDDIMQVIEDARASLGARGIDQWQDGYPDSRAIVLDIERGEGFVVCQSDYVVAYVTIVFRGESAYDDLRGGQWLGNAPYVVVHRLSVRRGFERRGLATLMMRYAERCAKDRGVCYFRIDTHRDNTYMLQMLNKFDFVYCGIVYYDHGERIAFEKIL